MTRICAFLLFMMPLLAQAKLVVSDATVRLLPPSLPNTSAYFSITNSSESDQYLTGASSSIVDSIELHTHVMKGEMMRMEKQAFVKVGAGETLKFQPGGLHLMLFGLNTALKENQTVTISLHTRDEQQIDFTATVVQPGEENSHAHHHH